jgi:hypothetical protein
LARCFFNKGPGSELKLGPPWMFLTGNSEKRAENPIFEKTNQASQQTCNDLSVF